MRLERFKCCWNTIRIFSLNAIGMKLEFSWNTFPVGMQLEIFEHEQNIPTAHKNGPE